MNSTETPRMGLFGLLHPGALIEIRIIQSSGSLEVRRLSEAQPFLWLTAALRESRQALLGPDPSPAAEKKERILTLLERWLDICSLDTGTLH